MEQWGQDVVVAAAVGRPRSAGGFLVRRGEGSRPGKDPLATQQAHSRLEQEGETAAHPTAHG